MIPLLTCDSWHGNDNPDDHICLYLHDHGGRSADHDLQHHLTARRDDNQRLHPASWPTADRLYRHHFARSDHNQHIDTTSWSSSDYHFCSNAAGRDDHQLLYYPRRTGPNSNLLPDCDNSDRTNNHVSTWACKKLRRPADAFAGSLLLHQLLPLQRLSRGLKRR